MSEYKSVYEILGEKADMFEAQLDMTVARLGGMVEGNPTARLNFLQRIDELVAKEAQLRQIPITNTPEWFDTPCARAIRAALQNSEVGNG